MEATDVEGFWPTLNVNGTNLHVELGEQLTQRQMIEAIMLVSANNIADSLVRWAFGSHEAYQQAAAEWLIEHDLTDTTIGADASGLDPGTTSSVSDLFEIGQLALRNPTLAEIMRLPSAVMPIVGEVQNTNKLVLNDPATIGIKTGTSDQAGACLLFASEHQVNGEPVVVIGVLTDQDYGTTFDTAHRLTDSALASLVKQELPADTVVGHYDLPWGKTVEITTTDPMAGVNWTDEGLEPTIAIDSLSQPSIGQHTVGTIWLSDDSSDLVIDSYIIEPNLWWRLTHLSELNWR
jgi:D-alanyl-D-alanine carboxypeptidase (penicillin-binding protein 5/6)